MSSTSALQSRLEAFATPEQYRRARAELLRLAPSHFQAFVKYVKPDFRFNWHHKLMCRYLDRLMRGEILFLMIFVEPQIGKSELVSRLFPAYFFGNYPDDRFLEACYGDSFASEFNIDVQRYMESDAYREIFPSVRLPSFGSDRNWVRNTSRFDIVGRDGRYNCVGVGSSTTGKTAHFLGIDDPVKGDKESRSAVYREEQWRWWKAVAKTRLRRNRAGMPPRICMTMTRWNHDDLAARVLAEAKANPRLLQPTVLSFPAEREDMSDPLDPRQIGEALWPANLTNRDYEAIKADPRTWNALYQQRPSAEQGAYLKRDAWKFFKEPPTRFDKLIQSWDLTFTEGPKTDFVVGFIAGRIGAKRYLLDRFRARVGFNGQLTAISGMASKWPEAIGKYLEKSANAFAAKQVLDKTISGVILWPVTGSKEFRCEAYAKEVDAGNWYLPDPSTCPWTHEFIEEGANFPFGKFDDQVDAWSQAAHVLSHGPTTDFMPVVVGGGGGSKWSKV
jgi:predicted phage terminase large subunit-like protein